MKGHINLVYFLHGKDTLFKTVNIFDADFKKDYYSFLKCSNYLNKIENEYFDLLADKFTSLEKIYKKKIEICLHPSSNLNFYKKKLKRFKVSKGNTIKKVLGSYMVIVHDSSSMMEALVAKKKILLLETNTFGHYISNRILFYKKTLKLPSINLHSNKPLNLNLFKDYKKTERYRIPPNLIRELFSISQKIFNLHLIKL